MTSREPGAFGALLLRHRAAAGLTREQLALRAGVSQTPSRRLSVAAHATRHDSRSARQRAGTLGRRAHRLPGSCSVDRTGCRRKP